VVTYTKEQVVEICCVNAKAIADAVKMDPAGAQGYIGAVIALGSLAFYFATDGRATTAHEALCLSEYIQSYILGDE
jgi:hypothetical protein